MQIKSECWNLYRELPADDRENYFRYLRMSKERFDHLLTLFRPYLLRESSRRVPVCPGVRLVITLRYLAEGMSQQNLSFSFRHGRGINDFTRNLRYSD